MTELKDLIAGAFRTHDVRWSPLALPNLLESGTIMPSFVAVAVVPSAPCWALVKQAVIGKAKAVLLGWGGRRDGGPELGEAPSGLAGIQAITV